MQVKRAVLSWVCPIVLFGGVSFSPLADHAHAQARQKLPPLQHTCPMHPEVLEDKPGSCHICKMPLEPTRKELESFPLTLSRDGKTLEAMIENDKRPSKESPAKMVLKVRLTKESPEQRFDFLFDGLSKEPPVVPPMRTTRAATTPGEPAPGPAGATTAAAQPDAPAAPPVQGVAAAPAVAAITNCEPNMTRTDALLLSDALPKSSKALINLLVMCSDEVQKLVQGAQFGFVYQPTMLGKDIALALENYVTELPDARRPQAADAIRRTVLAAWQLDLYGDMGNQEKITEAYNHFAAAIAAVKTAYGAQR